MVQVTPDRNRPWVVLKFGGTSVSTPARWEEIRRQVEEVRAAGRRPLLVCSALSQVSNQLEALLADAAGARDPHPGIQRLHDTHAALAEEMDLDLDAITKDLFDDLERTLTGISLTQEVTPRLRARVLSFGEFASTRLGAAWLDQEGLRASWLDARDLLEARREPLHGVGGDRQYLSATCSDEPDPDLDRRLRDLTADVVVTQGFIASGPDGDTVLLGRGGSDTSGAYLAAKLGAERYEIWTDVPGLFTANPLQIPEARLLRRLRYTEAGELASRGAKVLHPRCLRPVRRRGIPLHLRSTPHPDLEGTVIADQDDVWHGVLGVVARQDLVLVNIDLEGTWQRVGVIAEVASSFQALGLSIDMMAFSPTHVTVALDPTANQLDPSILDALRLELSDTGESRITRSIASVSIVGTSIADVLHELGPLLEDLEHENVHLISHAANDLSLTVTVDQDARDQVVQAMHRKLFETRQFDPDFGPTWADLTGDVS